jgi:CheY-specific phosphatase CheX
MVAKSPRSSSISGLKLAEMRLVSLMVSKRWEMSASIDVTSPTLSRGDSSATSSNPNFMAARLPPMLSFFTRFQESY